MNWFEIICLILIGIGFTFIILCQGAISNCNRRLKLLDGIMLYKLTCLANKEHYLVEFDDINDLYGIRDFLPWNWSYKKLLSADKYEIIKPYLKKLKGKENA